MPIQKQVGEYGLDFGIWLRKGPIGKVACDNINYKLTFLYFFIKRMYPNNFPQRTRLPYR
jgi:hypothetical protein